MSNDIEFQDSSTIDTTTSTSDVMTIDSGIAIVDVKDSLTISKEIKDNCLKLLQLREQIGADQISSFLERDDVKLYLNSLITSFLDIKSSNRETHLDTESKKLKLNEEKDKLDQLNLLHQNYLYEKNHLLKEIHSYSDFRIEQYEPTLVPLDYYEKGIQNANKEKLNIIDNDPNNDDQELEKHNLILNRLNFELNERTSMMDKLTQINQRIKLFNEMNSTKQKFLQSLPSQVGQLIKKVTPIQPSFNTNYNKNAFDLPEPLYKLYSSISSYKSSNNNINQLFNLKISSLERSNKFIPKENSTNIHPLYINLEYIVFDTKVDVFFYWSQDENLVLCKVANRSDHFFYNLFPQDTGSIDQFLINNNQQQQTKNNSNQETPLSPLNLTNGSQSSKVLSPIFNSPNFQSSPSSSTTSSTTTNQFSPKIMSTIAQYGKPYKWAQILAGLLPISLELNPNINQWNITSLIINSITKRIETRISLEKQINSLKKQIPKSISPSSLTSDPILVSVITDDTFYPILAGDDSLKLIFKNNNVEIDVLVIISSDYPIIPPLFQLFSCKTKDSIEKDANILLLQKETIKSIESTLNCFSLNNNNINNHNNNNELLSQQITKLKSIIGFLGDQSSIKLKCKDRFAKGKLRIPPLHLDPQTNLWNHT
ncbi:hypothetical protein CYY_008156 [Polysphondylium violaceum]|uniref:Uncharacterized protein n=1 Tax=Polysphondylium violaceum TaxID=133409 RepID=A0A8J4PNQ4_9MYCE|nr:hypothetical protein CYY_008156 [Polysphondylium violaceum]